MSVQNQSQRPKNSNMLPKRLRSVRNNSNPTVNHRTFFAYHKHRGSKIRYLSKSELIGISISVLLSFILAAFIVWIGFLTIPIIFEYIVSSMNESFENPSNNNQPTRNFNPTVRPQKISVYKNIDSSDFDFNKAKYFPFVLSLDERYSIQNKINSLLNQSTYLEHIANIVPTSYTSNKFTSSKINFNISLGDFLLLEKCLIDDSDYFLQDNKISETYPEEFLNSLKDVNNISANNFYSKFSNFFSEIKLTSSKNISHISGSSFHTHESAFSELFQGKKRWVFLKPGKFPSMGFNPYQNLEKWLNSSITKLSNGEKSEMIEFTQEEGQIVFVPQGWYHATQTLSTNSISISYQTKQTEMDDYYYYLKQGDIKYHSQDFFGSAKLYKLALALNKDYQALQHLGMALEREGSYIEAEKTYLEAIQINPLDPISYGKLINLYLGYSENDSSKKISDLLAKADIVGFRKLVFKLANQDI